MGMKLFTKLRMGRISKRTQTRISHLMQTLAQTPFVPSDHEHTDCVIQCKEQRTRKDNERGRRTERKARCDG